MRRFVPAITLLAMSALPAQTPPPPSAPAAELTYEDLVARPELAPRQLKPSKQLKLSDGEALAVASYPVRGLQNDGVIVFSAPGSTALLPPDSTDILSVANQRYQQMTPAQRALEPKSLAARPDLWPEKVTLTAPYVIGGTPPTIYDAGREMEFGSFDGKWVKARFPGVDYSFAVEVHHTDLFDRARAVVDTKRPSTVHRVLKELDGKLINLRTGKRAQVSPTRPPEYVVLYFSAEWCPGCRAFSPKLVSFYEQKKKAGSKRFELIWISHDKTAADMQAYAKGYGFPWLAVAWDKLPKVPITRAHDPTGIPDLVILDAKGAVVADSYVGNEYLGAAAVLEKLEGLLKQAQ